MTKRIMPWQKPGRSEQIVGTPPEFLIAARRRLGIVDFTIDLAATPSNAVVPLYLDEDADALRPDVSWVYEGWNWLNPPFGKIGPWVRKAYEQSQAGARTAVLIPAAVGANWWKSWVEDKAHIIPLNGRLTFIGHTLGYPKDCALLLYGPDIVPGYVNAWRWMDELTEEEQDMAKKRIGKAPKKANKRGGAQARVTKSRDKVRPIAAGRKKRRTPPPEDRIDVAAVLPESARVTTFKPNGKESRVVVPESDLRLPAIELPDPDAAVKVLGELAQLTDQAAKAKKRYEELKESTKIAKEKYDGINEQITSILFRATHKTDLPLFADLDTREEDQARMEAAGAAGGEIPESVPDAAPEPSVGDSGGEDVPADVPAADVAAALSEPSATPEPIPDEEIPF